MRYIYYKLHINSSLFILYFIESIHLFGENVSALFPLSVDVRGAHRKININDFNIRYRATRLRLSERNRQALASRSWPNSAQGGGRADAEEEGRVGGISRGARDGIVRFVFPRHG